MLIIGLSGRAQAGKDTAGDIIETEFGMVRVSFAESLKECVKAIYGFSDADVNDSVLKNKVSPMWGACPREYLQQLGTVLRNMDPDIWVKSAFQRGMKKFVAANREAAISRFDEIAKHGIVITDVRYLNEIKAIQEKRGIIIRIERPNHKYDMGTMAQHASETQLDDFTGWDYVLQNDCSLSDYQMKVTRLMTQIIAKKELGKHA